MADEVKAVEGEVKQETATPETITETASEKQIRDAAAEAEAEKDRQKAEAEAAEAERKAAEEQRLKDEAKAFNDKLKELINDVSANPGAVEFPTDYWGFTADVKRTVLLAASKVKGSDEKHRLLLGTLGVLVAHIRKRLEGDKQFFEDHVAGIEEAEQSRSIRERQHGLSTVMGE